LLLLIRPSSCIFKGTTNPGLSHLSMKEGSLFCFHPTGMLQIIFLVSLKSSQWGWVHGLGSMMFWTCSAKSSWILNDFSLKIKLNHSWKFRRIWNVPFGVLGKILMRRFNGIYLVKFGFRVWEIMIFKWFLLLKIQINSPQKTRFWKEKSVEDVVTLGPKPH
jgi:hypothetical protein